MRLIPAQVLVGTAAVATCLASGAAGAKDIRRDLLVPIAGWSADRVDMAGVTAQATQLGDAIAAAHPDGDFGEHPVSEARLHFTLRAIANATLHVGFDMRNAPQLPRDIWGNAALLKQRN